MQLMVPILPNLPVLSQTNVQSSLLLLYLLSCGICWPGRPNQGAATWTTWTWIGHLYDRSSVRISEELNHSLNPRALD
ncbi:uncharacterized protein B0J16DRAFT_336002 [Fusarium flagelliforme]|uniref:uncharacterized protein n=1 Tax=Fusarium flagelliforme TaxID=2675880 RepID=UPI001E8E190D|nr:uncharacterized protein B0J16DRAFT_336002 [Fusarium flagelliforme]KAH7193784.1 hypothetical protein B0J16DRAFT_336002 [Fusarium flagelliforme]